MLSLGYRLATRYLDVEGVFKSLALYAIHRHHDRKDETSRAWDYVNTSIRGVGGIDSWYTKVVDILGAQLDPRPLSTWCYGRTNLRTGLACGDANGGQPSSASPIFPYWPSFSELAMTERTFSSSALTLTIHYIEAWIALANNVARILYAELGVSY